MVGIKQFRTYGSGPAQIAVIHGGPSAPGEMAPVARELSLEYGVIEPIQTAMTVNDQIEELTELLQSDGDIPLILIGYSWGAWLSGMVAARHPHLVRKLILVSAGPFEEQYAMVWQNRMNRLTPAEQQKVPNILDLMKDPDCSSCYMLLAQFGAYCMKTDSYHPITHLTGSDDPLPCNHEQHLMVWEEAAALRRTGKLLACFQRISCPVVAIHGVYDPHPAAGVRDPLTAVLSDFRFIPLEKCGHCPWEEVEARDCFFSHAQNRIIRLTIMISLSVH
ncbi:MAG: alpha/beta hydrolase [Methanomicrobiales archaeon HGW-Methanomicrobiales-4]|nr:MAG: alpha/beta hydrolase [Methanomicrobiales archaeon HGW-Methanomicrobiales-4]